MEDDINNEHRLMVNQLKKSGYDILMSLTPEKCDLLHMAFGIVGEVGELADAIKKAVFYEKKLDGENVVEELGDIEFYLEGIRQNLYEMNLLVTRDATLQANINKLLKGKNARYASGEFSNEQAQERADKQ